MESSEEQFLARCRGEMILDKVGQPTLELTGENREIRSNWLSNNVCDFFQGQQVLNELSLCTVELPHKKRILS